ncbi:MAG: hypothetical protein P8Y78_09890 [Acidihalobacter sp.]
MSDFQTVFLNTDTRLALENILGSNHNPGSETQINGQQRLQVLYATLQQAPSADPIRLFWRYKSSYLTGAFEFFNRARVFAELGEHARESRGVGPILGGRTLQPRGDLPAH